MASHFGFTLFGIRDYVSICRHLKDRGCALRRDFYDKCRQLDRNPVAPAVRQRDFVGILSENVLYLPEIEGGGDSADFMRGHRTGKLETHMRGKPVRQSQVERAVGIIVDDYRCAVLLAVTYLPAENEVHLEARGATGVVRIAELGGHRSPWYVCQ